MVAPIPAEGTNMIHRHLVLAALSLTACSGAQPDPGPAQPYDTGGPLLEEQAAYDVLHYDIGLAVDPVKRSIAGEVRVTARAVAPLEHLVLDLDPRFELDSVRDAGGVELEFEWRDTRIWIRLAEPAERGDEVAATIAYHGSPREAPMPPWEGGFTWAETSSGQPWVGVSCQVDGADIWWPCKDHPSDEPDRGVDLHFTVPRPLQCVSNGRLVGTTEAGGDAQTFHWRVSTPINNYDVTLNIAPYRLVERPYTSVTGEEMILSWWALPEGVDRAERLLEEFADFVRFLEEELGPYPFRADKCAVVDTPYLAMEHQTAIAYGGFAEDQRLGFSWILLHELVHEWWGNLVSASDWRDFWLHEGFDGYMEARYVERRQGIQAYHAYIGEHFKPGAINRAPVAPREARSIRQVFATLGHDPVHYDTDAYVKGALVLHTLRYLVGEDVFATALRRWAYPEEALEAVSDGSQCRSASIAQYQELLERLSGRQLGWFFELYLRQPELPRLVSELGQGSLRLEWQAPKGLEFPMPVEVDMGDQKLRVEMPSGRAEIPWDSDDIPALDPDAWILRSDD
jgi:aminopeptidase N